MKNRKTGFRASLGLVLAALAALAISACGGGGSSSNASQLLKQTFSGHHTIKSGQLALSVSVTPSGSSTLTGPISLSFGGPFQSYGSGKLPASDFTVSVHALGKGGSLGIISTGTSGYFQLQGASYQMPATTFNKLEASFSKIGSSSSSGSSSTLSKLGISPLHWLSNPTVAGNETVGGAQTTHITASVDMSALLGDLNSVINKVGGSAAATARGISPATISKIAGSVKNPTVDVWTGTSDHTLRRLLINLTVPVTGSASTALGGMRSAQFSLSIQYSDLNQPQKITAPSNLRPFTEFAAQAQAFLQQLEGSFAGGALSSATGGSSTSSGTSAPNVSAVQLQKYSKCVQRARNNVTKMQACSTILANSG
jgi:hypothetical protein